MRELVGEKKEKENHARQEDKQIRSENKAKKKVVNLQKKNHASWIPPSLPPPPPTPHYLSNGPSLKIVAILADGELVLRYNMRSDKIKLRKLK